MLVVTALLVLVVPWVLCDDGVGVVGVDVGC